VHTTFIVSPSYALNSRHMWKTVRNVTADMCITLLSLQETYWGIRNSMPLFFLTVPDTYADKTTWIYYIYIYIYDDPKRDSPGFDSQQGQAFIYSRTAWPVLRANSAFRSMVVDGSYRGLKQPGRSWPLSPSAEVKSKWCYTSTPPICLRGVYRDNYLLP
jgi:hypothetical protein